MMPGRIRVVSSDLAVASTYPLLLAMTLTRTRLPSCALPTSKVFRLPVWSASPAERHW